MRLLKSQLTPAQLRQYEEFGWFDVIGGDTGHRFRIYRGDALNVDEYDSTGRCVLRWRFMPTGNLVRGDVLLAQKLALELFELEKHGRSPTNFPPHVLRGCMRGAAAAGRTHRAECIRGAARPIAGRSRPPPASVQSTRALPAASTPAAQSTSFRSRRSLSSFADRSAIVVDRLDRHGIPGCRGESGVGKVHRVRDASAGLLCRNLLREGERYAFEIAHHGFE